MSEFTMPIDETFAVPDGTVVVVGRVSNGEVRPGDSVDLCTPCRTIRVSVESLDAFGRLYVAMVGDNIGIRISGVSKGDVLPGSKLVARGAK